MRILILIGAVALCVAATQFVQAADPKLKYPQEQALKTGEGRIGDVEKAAQSLAATLEKFKKTSPTPEQVTKVLGDVVPQEKKLDAIQADLEWNHVPAEHSRTVALKGRMDKVREQIASLKKELEALAGAAPATPGPAGGPELDFKQMDALGKGEKSLTSMEQGNTQIRAQLEKARVSGNIRAVKVACGQQLYEIDKQVKVCDAVTESLARTKTPEAHPRTVALRARVDQAGSSLAAMRKEFQEIQVDTDKSMEVASYPDFARDLARLKEILARYQMNPGEARAAPAPLAALLQEDAALRQTVTTLREKYGRYVTAGTKESEDLSAVLKDLALRLPRYDAQLKELFEKHEIATSNDFKSAKHWSGGAGADAKSQKAAMNAMAEFKRSVELWEAIQSEGEPAKRWRAEFEALYKAFQDQVADAKKAAIDELHQKLAARLAALEADKTAQEPGTDYERVDRLIGSVAKLEQDLPAFAERAGKDDARAKDLSTRCTALREALPKVRAAVRQRYLDTGRLPKEVYAGADKEKLRGLVAAEWKKLYPADKVLEIRCHMEQWDRDVSWKSNETEIYKVDVSVLAVLVIVQTDEKIATAYPAYLNLNNLSGAMSVGAETKGKAYVHRELWLENLNK